MKTNYSKWLIVASIATTAIVAPMPEANASSVFKDLDSNSDVGKAMQKLVNLGVLSGFEDGTIRPNDPITRDQVAKMLTYLTQKNPDLVYQEPSYEYFDDVPNTHWAKNYISASYNMGYMQGNGNKFNPSGVLTRGDMAVILDNFFRFEEPTQTVSFTDVNPNVYYANAVKKLVANNITKGTSETTFSPNIPVTRGQLAVFFERSGLLDDLEKIYHGIDLSNVPREWTEGGLPEIASYIDFEINDLFSQNNYSLPNVTLRYDLLYSEEPDFYSEGVEDGTIIAIPHKIFNYYLNEYIVYTVLIEVENNQIKRFKYQTEEDMMKIYNRSTGMQNLSAYINKWLEEREFTIQDIGDASYFYSLNNVDLDFKYYTNHFSLNKHYFNFPDLTPFYVRLANHHDYSNEFIKIIPIGLGDNYDFTFEIASPTESFILENKNKRDNFEIETSDGLNYIVDVIQNDEYEERKIHLFVDADTTSKLEVGDYITYYYFTTDVDYTNDEMNVNVTKDYTKYTYNGNSWDIEEWTEQE